MVIVPSLFSLSFPLSISVCLLFVPSRQHSASRILFVCLSLTLSQLLVEQNQFILCLPYVPSRRPQTGSEVVLFAVDSINALSFLHSRTVAHCDIKRDNVLFAPEYTTPCSSSSSSSSSPAPISTLMASTSSSSSRKSSIYLIDFGHLSQCGVPTPASVGTEGYQHPEKAKSKRALCLFVL